MMHMTQKYDLFQFGRLGIRESPWISVFIPVFNEETNVENVLTTTNAVLKKIEKRNFYLLGFSESPKSLIFYHKICFFYLEYGVF